MVHRGARPHSVELLLPSYDLTNKKTAGARNVCLSIAGLALLVRYDDLVKVFGSLPLVRVLEM